MLTSPTRGGHQQVWSEEEDLCIGEAWLEFADKAKREKKYNGMSNSAIATGVHGLVTMRGGLGADKTSKQLEVWYTRKKQLYKKIKEKKSRSGAKNPIAQTGDKVAKGMVSARIWNMLRNLFGGDLAVVPPKEILGSAGGGMSEVEAEAAAAEQKEMTKKRSSTKSSAKSESKKKNKSLRTEIDDALNAEGDSSSSESDDSVMEILAGMGDMGSDDDKGDCNLDDEDEEASQVLKDDDVDVDAAAPKPPSLNGELAALRRKARMNASQYPTGNKADRQRMHQTSNSHTAF